MSFWKNPEFKALQKLWYQRIKDAGFEDAERLVDGEPILKKTSGHQGLVFFTDDLEEMLQKEVAASSKEESKASYYNFMAQKVQETVFTSAIDRLILEGHSEGKHIRHICEDLRKAGEPRGRNTVRFRIRIYEMRWGLRQYTPKQLNRYARKAS